MTGTRGIPYSMVLPDGMTLLFSEPGDRRARIFAYNWLLKHDTPYAFVIRRPRGRDPQPLFYIFIDGTMARVLETADPQAIPRDERGWITRKLVSAYWDGLAVIDAELVYERNVPLMVRRDADAGCGPVSSGWCSPGFVSIEGEVINGYRLEDGKVPGSFRVWTAEELEVTQ